MTTLYCSLDDVKREMLATSTTDDAKVLRFIHQISARIDTLFRMGPSLFVPTIAARRIALNPSAINSTEGTLSFNRPLLSLTGVGINSQTLVVGTTVQAYPVDSIPYFQVQLLGDAWSSWYTDSCSDARGVQFATLTGVWGYNEDYANAWVAVDTLAAAITTTTATTLTVTDVDGANPFGESPRISVGHLLQIDSEWMTVSAVNTTTNAVTVVRGVNGSTATTHLINVPVSVYTVDESIRRAVTRQAAAQYARQGAYETRKVTDFGAVDYPADLLTEVKDLLNLFANL